MNSFKTQIKQGKRFQFGKNCRNYIKSLTDKKIKSAEIATSKMLWTNNLSGKTVLNIGSGSGLFSLVARKLGASIHSFDYDPFSVICTKELRLSTFLMINPGLLNKAQFSMIPIIQLWGNLISSIRRAFYTIPETCGKRLRMQLIL